jgi:hypothetical protein
MKIPSFLKKRPSINSVIVFLVLGFVGFWLYTLGSALYKKTGLSTPAQANIEKWDSSTSECDVASMVHYELPITKKVVYTYQEDTYTFLVCFPYEIPHPRDLWSRLHVMEETIEVRHSSSGSVFRVWVVPETPDIIQNIYRTIDKKILFE